MEYSIRTLFILIFIFFSYALNAMEVEIAPDIKHNFQYDKSKDRFTAVLSLEEIAMRAVAHSIFIPYCERLQADDIDHEEHQRFLSHLRAKLKPKVQERISNYTLNHFYNKHGTHFNSRGHNIYSFIPRIKPTWNLEWSFYRHHRDIWDGDTEQQYVKQTYQRKKSLARRENEIEENNEQSIEFREQLKNLFGLRLQSCIKSTEGNVFAGLEIDQQTQKRKIHFFQYEGNGERLSLVKTLTNNDSMFNTSITLGKLKNGLITIVTGRVMSGEPISQVFDCIAETSLDACWGDSESFDYWPGRPLKQ